MIKSIGLFKRKPGLSQEEFAKHYEEVHAPLALKYFSTLFKRYVRNHVITPPGAEEPEFDCVTEIWFESMEDMKTVADFWQSEAGEVIRRDEETFMDRDKLISFIVEEKVSE